MGLQTAENYPSLNTAGDTGILRGLHPDRAFARSSFAFSVLRAN